MYNHTGLQGRLTATPELRYTPSGTAITSFASAKQLVLLEGHDWKNLHLKLLLRLELKLRRKHRHTSSVG